MALFSRDPRGQAFGEDGSAAPQTAVVVIPLVARESGGAEFTLYYNSALATALAGHDAGAWRLGPGWSASYTALLTQDSEGATVLEDAGTLTTAEAYPATVGDVVFAPLVLPFRCENTSVLVVADPDGTERAFDMGGQLWVVRYASGESVVIERDPLNDSRVSSLAAVGPDGTLVGQLTFGYAQDGHLAVMTEGAGRSWAFMCEGGQLARVEGPTDPNQAVPPLVELTYADSGGLFAVHTRVVPHWLYVHQGSGWVLASGPRPEGLGLDLGVLSDAQPVPGGPDVTPGKPPLYTQCSDDGRTWEQHTFGMPPNFLTWSAWAWSVPPMYDDFRGIIGAWLTWEVAGQASCVPGESGSSQISRQVCTSKQFQFAWNFDPPVGLVGDISASTTLTTTSCDTVTSTHDLGCIQCLVPSPGGPVLCAQSCNLVAYQGVWGATLTYWRQCCWNDWEGPWEQPMRYPTARTVGIKYCDRCFCDCIAPQ